MVESLMVRSMILPMHPIRMLKHFDIELNGRTIVSFLAFLKGGLDPCQPSAPRHRLPIHSLHGLMRNFK